jgi:hypothetical protein
MSYLAFLAAAILATLATLHLIYTIRDFGAEPRYFAPRDPALLAAMRTERAGIAPNGRDFWSGLLGFHLSHSIGIFLFALLIVLATVYQIGWLKVLLVGLGCVFAWIAWRCWFNIPLIGCVAATASMLVGWAL